MNRAAITLYAALLLLVMVNSTFQSAVQASTASDLTYPSNFWNSSNIQSGPYVSKIATKVTSYAGALSDVETGAADAASRPGGFKPTDEASLCSIPSVECRIQDDLGFTWLGFNQRSYCDPFLAHGCDSANLTQYLDFRQAMDYAIPRANIVATQFLGNGLPTCQSATPAWGQYFDTTLTCKGTGTAASTAGNTTQIWAHLNALTLNFPTKFAWATGSTCNGFPTNGTSGECFTNVTAGRPVVMNMLNALYDPVRIYAQNQLLNNLHKVGFDLIASSGCLSDLVCLNRINTYQFNAVIEVFGFPNNIPDYLFYLFSSSQDTCSNVPVGSSSCIPYGYNLFGVHDSVLDGYLNTLHTNLNPANVLSADHLALQRIYSQAWFLPMYSRKLIAGVRTDLYHGYFNEPGQGPEGLFAFNWEFVKAHSTSCLGNHAPSGGIGSVLPSPCDNPARPFTVDMASDIGHVNPWETLTEGSVWDFIAASATGNQAAPSSGAALNLLDPNTYALTPWVAPLPTVTIVSSGSIYPGTSTVCAPTAPATNCEQIVYTITTQGAFIGNGAVGTAAGPRLVTAADYKSTLDYARLEHVPAFQDLFSVMSNYSLSGNTLTLNLNGTGSFRLYQTNLQPTDARYWCTTSACTAAKHAWNEEPTTEETQLNMFDNSTTGPFLVILHDLVTGEIDYAQNPYYFQSVLSSGITPRCTTFRLTFGPPGCVPEGTFGFALLGSLVAIPAIAIASKRRRRSALHLLEPPKVKLKVGLPQRFQIIGAGGGI